ncbi:NAD(P)H-dependent oxidoreductase subunit E [Myxococcota bacterium]|nr:NAD(P)H-dependent oxidoreductase subunit E [Myxococcota bacterium]MBU1379602.1 NAD(P)H-dependent oxidoreductase subunit E [Myxococcota bacterium]MBU1496299.1 NAD(P)H-dependent oxidoreductase subunit E [Myxococcota bacterium]
MDAAKLDSIIDGYNGDETAILAILQDIQAEFNYLPKEAMKRVAEKLNVPFSRVSALATFFAAFALNPRGKHIVTVCMGTACHVRGAPRVLEEIERDLKIKSGENTPDMAFTIETVNCVGACALGPLVIVNGNYHGNLTTSEVTGMIDQYRGQ